VAHNLISFKSFQESLDAWSLKELVGHYVNYRKQLFLRTMTTSSRCWCSDRSFSASTS
jgi:hypothetical protein